MCNSSYGSAYDGYLAEFNAYAGGVYNELTESTLTNAMKYSFFAGGKRVRPVIMMACAEKLGGNLKKILPFAFALECIHTYSLVHDDLPAIDNDVLRRGKPTCHIAYGEAAAVLAGDGLLNFAFEHLLGNVTSKREIEATKIIAEYSGYDGMLGGQAADVENEKRKDCGIDELNDVYDKKTGKFLTLPFLIPSILFAPERVDVAKECGKTFGRLFQYCDDLLDVLSTSEKTGKNCGKDARDKKRTSVGVLGVDGVRNTVIELQKRLIFQSTDLIDEKLLKRFLDKFVGEVL